jgi:hypothetical protein
MRHTVYGRLVDQIKRQLTPESMNVRIGLQAHNFGEHIGIDIAQCVIQPATRGRPSNITDFLGGHAVAVLTANELREFCRKLPMSVTLLDKQMPGEKTQDRTSVIFATGIANELGRILFSGPIPEPASVDILFAASVQFLWNMFATLGQSLPRCFFECRLNESLITDEVATQTQQVELMNGTAPSPPAKDRLMNGMVQRLSDVLAGDISKLLYIPSLKGVWAADDRDERSDITPSKFFTSRQLKYCVRNFGLHGAVAMDATVIRSAGKLMVSIAEKFSGPSIQKVLRESFDEFRKKDQIASVPDLLNFDASEDIVRLGLCLQVRGLLREATREVTQEALPGFCELVEAAKRRLNRAPDGFERILIEIVGGDDSDFAAIGNFLAQSGEKLPVLTDLNLFLFYIALHLGLPKWEDVPLVKQSKFIPREPVRYMANYDAFTGNFHLFPIATWAFLRLLPTFFDRSKVGDEAVTEALDIFFATLAQIAALKKQGNCPFTARAVTIVADICATVMKLEYGRIEGKFPTRVISLAYSVTPDPSLPKTGK